MLSKFDAVNLVAEMKLGLLALQPRQDKRTHLDLKAT